MTVGGLDEPEEHGAPPRSSELRLAVHHPSDRSLSDGLARVFELFADAERFAALADGLHLGRVRRGEEEGRVFLEPEIDYEDGLYHVVVLAPPGEGLPLEARRDPSLFDSSWLAVAPLTVADPNPARESAKLRAGARDGVRPGAAVAMGPRLVGRVTRVGPTTCDLSFVGDPGFSVVAVALFEGTDEPRILGRLVTLGRESGTDRVRMRWNARIALELEPTAADGTRGARLFTGSGDSGLESGFFLGEARLPVAGDDREPSLWLSTGFVPAESGALHVRLDPGEGGGAAP
jgi:hypothetical protein